MRSEKFKAIVKELSIRCRKLNISIVFITKSYFRTPKDVRLNGTHYMLMKIGNKKRIKKYSRRKFRPYSFMLVYTRPTARVTFRKNFDEPVDLRHL